jgi:hypothetical protein
MALAKKAVRHSWRVLDMLGKAPRPEPMEGSGQAKWQLRLSQPDESLSREGGAPSSRSKRAL